MPVTDWLLFALLLIPAAATLLPLYGHDHWSVRIFDFPRQQIILLGLAALLCTALFRHSDSFLLSGAMLAAAGALVWQLVQISPYTRLYKPQVLSYRGADDGRTISILAANVLTPNRRTELLCRQIDQYRPDIVLTLESDAWWETQLAHLETDYGWTVKVPLDNLYGMHLYSRLPLRNAQVLYRVRDDIPSIHAEVCLPGGDWIHIFCLHPMPPSPTESDTATERDGELLLVGREIAAHDYSCLVFGDLNDVAWSHTSRLFRRISGLLDPRIGRGFYNTFHAGWWFLRWPLDHIYHSNDFMVSDLQVLPHIGSDHFPVYGKFQYRPRVEKHQPEPEIHEGDHAEAAEKIDAADPIHERERVEYPGAAPPAGPQSKQP